MVGVAQRVIYEHGAEYEGLPMYIFSEKSTRHGMETSSQYMLQPDMTFQIDTFVTTESFGIRWEKGVVIRPGGCKALCSPIGTMHELEF